jgi:7-cyano-7-deazaguanine synthase
MASALSLGLAFAVEIAAPYRDLHKADVIRRGAELAVPFERTLSCMNPVAGDGAGAASPRFAHCGACSKCRERRDAFVDAGVPDPTTYVSDQL